MALPHSLKMHSQHVHQLKQAKRLETIQTGLNILFREYVLAISGNTHASDLFPKLCHV